MNTLAPHVHPLSVHPGDDQLLDGYCSSASSSSTPHEGMGTGVWTKEEHGRFLEAIKIYANGPWKLVAAYVGTRTVRQTMTHAQKYRQKAARRLRGLRTKQALMRMHFGHRVSEESLVQERLRALGMLQRGRYHPSMAAPAPVVASIPLGDRIAFPVVTIKTETELDTADKTHQVSTPMSTPVESPPAVDAFAMTTDNLNLLDELATGPSLEECASVLMDLLF